MCKFNKHLILAVLFLIGAIFTTAVFALGVTMTIKIEDINNKYHVPAINCSVTDVYNRTLTFNALTTKETSWLTVAGQPVTFTCIIPRTEGCALNGPGHSGQESKKYNVASSDSVVNLKIQTLPDFKDARHICFGIILDMRISP